MNLKILNEVEYMLQTSPQALRNPAKLKQLINGIFSVELDDVSFSTVAELTDKIDTAVLHKYFGEVWQPETKKFKYSGLKVIEEVNALKPRNVLDIGCGYNEFKGKIPNLIGIDPYNTNADYEVGIIDYNTDIKFDVIIALGSINFGSTDKVFAELEKAVSLCAPGAVMFFRVNPGHQHDKPEAKWITFYPWNSNFIMNCADYFNVDVLDLRNDSNNRMYFVWRTK
jgi:hypothetical protein|tara:strand:- start:618 stop:1295 length:678 start_codon:yes stop_codon:yes gene_type:complete